MSDSPFSRLDNSEAFLETRSAMHAYSRVLGDCLKACRSKRKHWWHASLRPSLNGLTTGVVHSATDFEIELDFRRASMHARSGNDGGFDLALDGQPASEIAAAVGDFMSANGVADVELAGADSSKIGWPAFSHLHTKSMGQALGSVVAAMETFRSSIREETSPIQLWPHHFDLSMLWLPGEKIPGQDPVNEELSDKQMNFGFTFGDDGIAEPYFYVTAYPASDSMAATRLPTGSEWRTDGFNGAVLTYQTLQDTSDPGAYLQNFWSSLLASGQHHMLARETED